MKTIYRILGKKGRVTIPYEFRKNIGFAYNDVLSFTQKDDSTVVIKREKICDCCGGEKDNNYDSAQGITLHEFLDNLSAEQQRAALIHLSVKWSEKQGCVSNVGA